ncbi:MAG: hypothetical protein L0H53_10615, partial [Candidatus Nitrosocosmicus sp.]|nr:hypothetical protein [Candidatus Nitrosocosmicus sp.]
KKETQKTYNSFFFLFYKTKIKRIKEFELRAIDSIIKKFDSQEYEITFSKDLQNSKHLVHITKERNTKEDTTRELKIIHISRQTLRGLFSSLMYKSLSKYLEFYQLGIEESFEEEMVERIKDIFLSKGDSVDRRNKISFRGLFVDDSLMKTLIYGCPNCKIGYPNDYKSKCQICGGRIYLLKKRPSKRHLKKRRLQIEAKLPHIPKYFLSFINFMVIMRDNWFVYSSFRKGFQQQFDSLEKSLLNDLKMYGDTHYSIVHYYKSKKKECYIKKDLDFVNISIKTVEYNDLVEDFVKARIYGTRRNEHAIYESLNDILRNMNFPERVLEQKLAHDRYEFDMKYFRIQKLKSYELLVSLLDKSIWDPNTDPYLIAQNFISVLPVYFQTLLDKKMVSKDERETMHNILTEINSINKILTTPAATKYILKVMSDLFLTLSKNAKILESEKPLV